MKANRNMGTGEEEDFVGAFGAVLFVIPLAKARRTLRTQREEESKSNEQLAMSKARRIPHAENAKAQRGIRQLFRAIPQNTIILWKDSITNTCFLVPVQVAICLKCCIMISVRIR